jgi:hypothetical protein
MSGFSFLYNLDLLHPPFSGAATFDKAGPATEETIDFLPFLPGGVRLNGGVLVGDAAKVFYATEQFPGVSADPSLQPVITIKFAVPIYNFKVKIFDALSGLLGPVLN